MHTLRHFKLIIIACSACADEMVNVQSIGHHFMLHLLTAVGPYLSSWSNCSAANVPSILSQFLLKTE